MRQFVQTDNGRWSLTKFWSFIGCGVSTWIMIYLTLKDKISWEFFIVYLASVCGFSQLSKFMAYRYGAKTDVANDTETVPEQNVVNSVEIKKCTDCPTKPEKQEESDSTSTGD